MRVKGLGISLTVCVIYTLHHLDLISRMQLSEKISQLGTGAGAIARLTVPAYQW